MTLLSANSSSAPEYEAGGTRRSSTETPTPQLHSDLQVDQRPGYSDLEVVYSQEGLEVDPSHGRAEALERDNLQPYHRKVPHDIDGYGPIPTSELAESGESDGSKKESPKKTKGWKGLSTRAKRVWVAVGIILLLAIVGGVVGGVLSSRGSRGAPDDGQSSSGNFSDAILTSPTLAIPETPMGHYTLNNLDDPVEFDSCATAPDGSSIWNCGRNWTLGVTTSNDDPGPTVQFDDYSLIPRLFRYGPQPPDFNGTRLPMLSAIDKNSVARGLAAYANMTFDKLVILPENLLQPASNKRSLLSTRQSDANYTSEYLEKGDQPWFCFFNRTIVQLFIYLDQNYTDAGETATAGGFPASGTRPPYPKAIKLGEKRKPSGNVQPYCQQMQVLDNWSIVPRSDIGRVLLKETDYETAGSRLTKRDLRDDLRSNCVCQWDR